MTMAYITPEMLAGTGMSIGADETQAKADVDPLAEARKTLEQIKQKYDERDADIVVATPEGMTSAFKKFLLYGAVGLGVVGAAYYVIIKRLLKKRGG